MAYTTALGLTPIFTVSQSGEYITSHLADRLVMIKIESREGGGDADTLDLTLDDRDWNIASPSIGEGSVTLSVSMGYAEGVLYEMGTYEIDELSYSWTPKSIRMHGNSLGMSTNAKAPILASYDNTTLGTIVGKIAITAGVGAVVDPALSSIDVPFLNQNSSSMHLLQELERRFNGLAKFQDGKLSFTKRGTGDSASGQSLGTVTLTPEYFGTGSVSTTNRFAYSTVQASWWDKTANQLQWLKSSTSGNANSSVPYMISRAYNSQQEAQDAANSTMSQLNRRSKDGTVTLAKGDPSIRGGQVVAITGCREGINGSYIVRRAVHSLSKDSGLVTTLDIYDDGDGENLPAESTTGSVDYSGAPASTIPGSGVGHM